MTMPKSGYSLQDFREYCEGKNVLLVGNNLTALERKQGAMIDEYDIVVRFGKGIMPGYEEFIGSRTDVWMTGEFRRDMRHMIPDTKWVLYNPSWAVEREPPEYDHVEMFTPTEGKKWNSIFCKGKARLSAGAYTSLFFKHKVKTYKSLTFINFDFFQQSGRFTDKKHDQISYANSWHLPLLRPGDIPQDPSINPVHDHNAEKAVFESIKDNRVKLVGLAYQRPTMIKLKHAAWDTFRQPE